MSYGGGYNNSGGGYHSGGYDSGGYNSGGGGGGNNYSNVDYSQAPNPGPYTYEFNDSSAQISSNKYSTEGYKATSAAPKKGTSKWIKIGIPVVLVLVAGGVVAGIMISRNKKSDGDGGDGSSSPSKNNGTSTGTGNTGGDNAISDGTPKGSGSTGGNGQFFSSVDDYFLPVYPTKDNPQLFAAPSFASGSAASSSGAVWPEDTFKPATPSLTTVRPNRPRLIAPKYKWDALPQMITADPYLKAFDDQIIKNATAYRALPRVRYAMDGGSGILDVSREKKMRIKAYAYAWRRDNNSQWIDAAWRELQHAMGTAPDSDWALTGDNLWYPTHFLDVAEMTAAFAIAYDWMYDGWTEDQRGQIRAAIIRYGLSHGGVLPAVGSNWWSNATSVRGNWNCVCNSGLTMGALAILGDDDSGVPERILSQHPANAAQGCVNAPTSDGTWRESPNYWYFGTTGHAEITSSLMTATGGDFGLLNNNPHYKDTAMFHMYVTGMTSLFDYADHGPNKFSTNANSLIFYGSAYNEPRYTLYQRDHFDAPNPFSVFWYDPTVRGAWWNGLALDHEFADPSTQWVSMRSSWTDNTGTYLAMKSSGMRQYQTHGDLDAGDFVFDAMGERWFGELGSGDYLSSQYFNSEDQDAVRWTYYRKMTEGQNTILIKQENQNVDAAPTMKFESTGDKQGSSPTMSLQQGSTAYAVTDMSSAYSDAQSVKRGVRFLHNRKQVLIQDEITANGLEVRWRAHTNATVTPSGNTATLTLHGKTLTATILSPATGATFTADPAVRLPSSQGTDQANPGVTVLQITMTPTAATTIQVLLAPKWDSTTTFDNPPSVALDQWSLTSHP